MGFLDDLARAADSFIESTLNERERRVIEYAREHSGRVDPQKVENELKRLDKARTDYRETKNTFARKMTEKKSQQEEERCVDTLMYLRQCMKNGHVDSTLADEAKKAMITLAKFGYSSEEINSLWR